MNENITVFVTNLDDKHERRNFIQKQLSVNGINLEFVKCIDGRKWTDQDIEKNVSKSLLSLYNKNFTWLSKGAIAATKTVVERVYTEIVNRGLDYALFFEDDVTFPENPSKYLHEILTEIRRKKIDGVILLHYHALEATILKKDSKISLSKELDIFPLPIDHKIASGAGFIISNSHAKTMVQTQTPIDRIGDWWSAHVKSGGLKNVYIIHPMVLRVGEFESTLGYNDRKTIKGMISSFIKFLPFSHKILAYLRTKNHSSKSNISFQ